LADAGRGIEECALAAQAVELEDRTGHGGELERQLAPRSLVERRGSKEALDGRSTSASNGEIVRLDGRPLAEEAGMCTQVRGFVVIACFTTLVSVGTEEFHEDP
jgi:hypothetical protein